jgi:RsiW-degrading membrane proteinase PrsW (M82 family)
MIFFAFIAGIIAVPLVLPFEKLACTVIRDIVQRDVCANTKDVGIIVLIIWAAIEEIFKFMAAYFVAMRSKYMDEPIDGVVYMITAALGFAALENTFFILGPLLNGNLFEGLVTGNLRFIGASLLHTVSSAAIGVAIAFSYYKRATLRHDFLLVGIFGAIILHTFFNFFIIQQSGVHIFLVFGSVWVGAIILLLLFEKIKRVRKYPPAL